MNKKIIILGIFIMMMTFLSGIAFARLSSVQTILNNVWDTSNDALTVKIVVP